MNAAEWFEAVAGAGASTYPWYASFDIDWINDQLTVDIFDPDGDDSWDWNPDSPVVSKKLTATTMWNAYAKLRESGREFSIFAPGVPDLDADDADVIIQTAVLGDIIYG